jgi:beta-mannosidase
MMRNFRFPTTFQSFVYLSQLVQALAIKTAVEHWRRLKPYCSGTLYWQLNDIWPGISWSSLEHSGKWKLLNHFATHFYSDVLVSAMDEGTGLEKMINLWITSDELSKRAKCVLRVDMVNIIGKSVASIATKTCEVEPQSSSCALSISVKDLLAHIPIVAADKKLALEDNCFLVLSLIGQSGQHLSSNLHFFAAPKRFTLPKCDISVKIEATHPGKIDLLLKAPTLALFVALECTSASLASGHFSENGFCMLPFEEKKVSFVFDSSIPTPTVAEFTSNFKVMSLRDSY